MTKLNGTQGEPWRVGWRAAASRPGGRRSFSKRRPTGVVSALAVWICLGGVAATGSSGGVAARGAAQNDCGSVLSAQEAALARLYETSRRQRRRRMKCSPLLSRVARARAVDMGTRGYFGHVNPDGVGPNRQVERAGYRLPASYGKGRRSNNVEVIAAGHDTAEEAWEAWLRSRRHRPQVLGSSEFFRDQTEYGVGFASVPGSRYGTYWVLISAQPR